MLELRLLEDGGFEVAGDEAALTRLASLVLEGAVRGEGVGLFRLRSGVAEVRVMLRPGLLEPPAYG